MHRLEEMLQRKAVLVADGATGTQLQRAGLPAGKAPEAWNIENPAAIKELHRSYLEAGAEIVSTNSFGGNRIRLAREGLEERAHEVNVLSAQLAREEVGAEALVFGSMGPTGVLLEPLGELPYAAAKAIFAEQASALVEGGVDALLIETMSDLSEARAAVEAALEVVPSTPVIVTMSFDTKGRTMMGVTPEQAARELWSLGVAAVGANCGRTLEETLVAITMMRSAMPQAVLMAKPNAGLPRMEQLDVVYDVEPEVMADYARRFMDLGVRIVGACCGSTPAHIAAIAGVVRHPEV